jgi:hypothetical protein
MNDCAGRRRYAEQARSGSAQAGGRWQVQQRIALNLDISEDTVKAHVKNILTKLMANDRTHAAVLALQRGIIELNCSALGARS